MCVCVYVSVGVCVGMYTYNIPEAEAKLRIF